MIPRWWRIGVLVERGGEPWTWTFHVRAFTERSARRLVAAAVEGPHRVYACHASEPLRRAARREEIAARYGPYRRSWSDPAMAPLSRESGPDGPRSGR